MAEELFRLPRSSYDELVRIIRGYEVAGPDANLEAVSQAAAINRTIVSRNNGFLVGTGILKGGKKKSLTRQGLELAKALDYEMPDQIEKAWKAIVSESDFFSKVLSAVRIRKGMDHSALQTHIAYTAGEPKRGAVLTGAGAVIEILRAAGTIREEDGKHLPIETQGTPREEVEKQSDLRSEPEARDILKGEESVQQTIVPRSGFPLGVTIEVRVDCKPDDLPALASKLADLLRELHDAAENREPEE